MTGLVRELTDLHNPGMCAFLLWRYAETYQSNSTEKASSPFVLLFLVLPLLLNREMLQVIASTQARSGLDKALGKLSLGSDGGFDGPGRGVLQTLNDNSLHLRELTCRSLAVACQCHLLDLDTNTGSVMANGHGNTIPDLPDSLSILRKGAERVGAWFALLSEPEIYQKLRVEP